MKNEKFEEYTEKLKEIFVYMNPEEPEEEEDDDEFGTPVDDDFTDDDFKVDDWDLDGFGTPVD